MNYFLLLCSLAFFLGCSKENSSATSYLEDDINNPISNNPLYYQQWSINYDSTFYNTHGIDNDAHIHVGDILTRYNGRGVKVAIIDDGFDTEHPEINTKIIAKISVLPSGISTSTDVSHTYSNDMHGTAVAGIIAASNNSIGLMGVASNVSLILIKIPMDRYSDAVGIKAFDVAEYWGADIITCSWGTGDVSDAMRSKIIDVATNGRNGKGAIVLFASGNDDADIADDEASINEVLAVGATNKENLRTGYSNYGEALDIVAPGGEYLGITTIDPLGVDGASVDEYNRFDELRDGNDIAFAGTSAATPTVAASVALLLQKNPLLTRQEVFGILASKSDKIGLNVPYIDDIITTYSNGAIISGSFASSGMSDFQVQILQEPSQTLIGTYSIASLGAQRWEASITTSLEQGEYTARVVAQTNTSTIYASDTFSVNNSLAPSTDTSRQKNHFYGCGKINVDALME